MSKEGTTTLNTERFLELLDIEDALKNRKYLEIDGYENIKLYGNIDDVNSKIKDKNRELSERIENCQKRFSKRGKEIRRQDEEIRNFKISKNCLENDKGFYKSMMWVSWGITLVCLILIFLF